MAPPTGTCEPDTGAERVAPEIGELELEAGVNKIPNRWPSVGLAVGVVANGRLEFFHDVCQPVSAATLEGR